MPPRPPTPNQLDESHTFPPTVTGDLALHGVTKPITLTATHFACGEHPMKKVAACGADLVGTLKRSDFGISTYVPLVGDEVTLAIEVEAARQ